MKTILFFFVTFVSSDLFSQSNDWKLLGKNQEKIYYFKPNSNDTGWVKIESSETEYYDKNQKKIVDGYSLNLWKFDCEERQMGIVQSITYDKNNKLLKSFSLKSYEIEMSYVVPNSNGELFLKTFCEE